MECPHCFDPECEIIEINFTLFRHLGFVDLKKNGFIGMCRSCQLLFNILSPEENRELIKSFQSNHYASSNQTDQTFFIKKYHKRLTRSCIQADILSEYIENNRPTVLDIGCFNGELLRELNVLFQKSELYGFDVNKHLKSIFPSQNNFHFLSTSLDKIEIEFDLICMSHSIIYIRDINQLFRNIRRILKPDGLLFIQTPNIIKNPYSILLADQYYYFTTSIFRNILHSEGLDFYSLDNDWCPRDIVVIAKKGSLDNNNIEDKGIYQCIMDLNEKRAILNSISHDKSLCVLGTTISAAFVESVLRDRIQYFVDENVSRLRYNFRGKKVIHPRSMDKSDSLIIPYGPSNKGIKQRFSKNYNLKQFVTI